MGLFTLLAALALLFLRFEVDGGMLRRDYGFERLDTEGNVGDRLFLTPYIKSGQTEKGLFRVEGLVRILRRVARQSNVFRVLASC